MNKTISIFSNINTKSILIKDVLVSKLLNKGYSVIYNPSEEALLNVCIGGDGSFLRAVHDSKFSQVPFVGINTGHLGFYQEILISEIDTFIDDFINDNYSISKLALLQGIGKPKTNEYDLYALNEFVIKSKNSSIVHLDVYIDDYHLERFAGDGLIISTPSGSTAYNFSVGGSVLYHELKGYQLAPIAPINSRAYRSLMNSIVMPDTSILKIVPDVEDLKNLQLITDGNVTDTGISEQFEFKIAKRHINKLVFNPRWYWINIKDKFL